MQCSAFSVVIFLLALPLKIFGQAGGSYPTVPPTPPPQWEIINSSSSFFVASIDVAKEPCSIPDSLAQSFKTNGFVQCACPFGVLLVADQNYKSEYLKYGANIVANLIDNDNNGEPDAPNVLARLTDYKSGTGTALVCGTTKVIEEKNRFITGLAYSYGCQTYKDIESIRGILVEEIFHMVHQMGFAREYPDQFGLQNFTSSIVCRETARLQCVRPGWWHDENRCPDGAPFANAPAVESPIFPGTGDCTYSQCDCAEFYRQAATLYMDWTDCNAPGFWYSPYMPRTKAGFTAIASQDLLEMMGNPAFHQPQAPLSGCYTISGPVGTTGTTKGKIVCKPVSECPTGPRIPNGEEACEFKGFTAGECAAVGCCLWNQGSCWSKIGKNPCPLQQANGVLVQEPKCFFPSIIIIFLAWMMFFLDL